MDRRTTPANSRAALDSLRGRVDAPRYVTGEAMQVAVPLADLLDAPDGARQRQVLLGDGFRVIDRDRGFAFGQSLKDGYCGYLPEVALETFASPTHWVAAPATHLYPEPRVQAPEIAMLTFGARVAVTSDAGNFTETTKGFIPSSHLRALDDTFTDPVTVAMQFLGTPYLWGGNSRAGIDCSGLAQASLLACGIACPGDSDLQQSVGRAVGHDDLQRGDLIFWKGHVALIANAQQMIHATGFVMATILENTEAAIARILARNGGPVTARRRP